MGLLHAFPRLRRTLVCLRLASFSMALAVGAGRAVAQQGASEEAAFAAAWKPIDPDQRATALAAFLRQFPSGARSHMASHLLLDAYLDSASDHAAEIHKLGQARIASEPAGLERWLAQAHLADSLANAGNNGTNLADAKTWASDAVSALTREAYQRQNVLLQQRYKLPPLTPGQVHRQFANDRATVLAALANVQLRLDAPAAAAPLLAEATRLDPHAGEVLRLCGELALQQKHPQQALAAFMEASAVIRLAPRWQAQMLALFTEREHTSPAVLDERIDGIYRSLYPPVFALPRRPLPAGGHPVLLELFTGSDCEPCAGPDLAVDSLLGSYARKDLIVLEYDQHIPRPDPLANPDSVDRAAFYAAEATPEAFLDGAPADLLGSSRADVENIVVGLGDQLEGVAVLPSGLRLSIDAETGDSGQLKISAGLKLHPGSAGPTPTPSTGDVSLRSLQRAVLYLALAEDDVRYPGQNGVRFHRMVVRALRQVPAATLLGSPAQPARFTLDPAELDRRQGAYLSDYELHNDRLGPSPSPLTNVPIRTDHLAVVAWVQDPGSRHVLQSVFAVVPPPR